MKNLGQLLGHNTTLLAMCYQHLSVRLNRQLDSCGLNMTQMSILTYLARLSMDDNQRTVGQVASDMEMNQPMVAKALKPLVQRGYMDKCVSENDGRMTFLSLNGRGREALLQAQTKCGPLLKESFAKLEEAELIALAELLEKFRSSLFDEHESG